MKQDKEIERLLNANVQKALVIEKIVQYLITVKSLDRDKLLNKVKEWKEKYLHVR